MAAELKRWRTEVALPFIGLKANVCESWDAFGHSKKEWTALLDQLLVASCIPYVIVLPASSKPAAQHLQSSPWLQFFFLSPPYLEYHCHHLCCSVTRLYLTLQDRMDWGTPGLPVLHHLPKFAQTHIHWFGDAIQPSHSLSPLSPVLSLSQHQSLFQWVSS